MRDIRIYDFEFNLLCVLCDVISSQWRILYNGVGTYEGHFRLSDAILKELMSHDHVVIVQGDMQAICVGKIIENELTVCGRTVNWILTRRIRPPFKTSEIYNGEYQDAETILIDSLKWGFTEPPYINEDGSFDTSRIDERKRVDNFILPEAVGFEKFPRHFWRTGANDLENITKDLCTKMNRGHKVVFDIKNKCWRFEFIFPKENDILISKESKTAYETEYKEDILNYATGGWYPYYDPENLFGETADSWRYIFSDDKEGIYLWDASISGMGESEAAMELEKKKFIKRIDAKVRNFEYQKDYDIGDIVTAYVRFGEFERLGRYLISGVKIKYTPNDSYTEPILEEFEENAG